MVVFCPSCGSKISVEPQSPGGAVECPRCHSTFSTGGLKSADDAPPPKRFKSKKKGGSKVGVVLIVLLILLALGGGTAGVLWYTGVIGNRTASGSTSKQPDWQEYTNAEGRFTVLFPGTPTRDTVPPPSRLKAGAKPRIVSFTADTPTASYSVAFEDFTGSETPEKYVDTWRADLGSKGTKLVSEKDVTAGSNKGKELVVEVNGRTAHVRFFVAGRRLYKLQVVGAGKPPESREAAKFMDSFRITT
jgi:hypothetical protein